MFRHFRQVTAVLSFVFLVPNGSWAAAKSCLPGQWDLVASVEGKFTLDTSKEAAQNKVQKVSLWEQNEQRTAEFKKERHAALILGDCEAVIVGYRAGREQKLPYADAELSKAVLKEGQDLIQVVSSYSHGYAEANTQLYFLDASKQPARFVKVWDAMTLKGFPGVPETAYVLSFTDINHDGYADLTLTTAGAKDQTWLWNPKNRSFDASSK